MVTALLWLILQQCLLWSEEMECHGRLPYRYRRARIQAHLSGARSFCSSTPTRRSKLIMDSTLGSNVRLTELGTFPSPEMDLMLPEDRRPPWTAMPTPRPRGHQTLMVRTPSQRSRSDTASHLDTTAPSSFGDKCDSQPFEWLWFNWPVQFFFQNALVETSFPFGCLYV